jgi:16S rRNA (uracil1498-N3)-methyltransferase
MSSVPKIRLFVNAALDAGARVMLEDAPAHYVRHVMRAEAAAPIALFNGKDGEWHGRIGFVGKSGVLVSVERQVRAQAATLGPTLLFAPLKREANEWLIEKATELGVARFRPVLTERTEIFRHNLARWQSIATEAAEQCERLDVPAIEPPVPLGEVLAVWPVDRTLLACVESGAAQPIAHELASRALAETNGRPAALLIGPAGGFSAAERDQLSSAAFVRPIGLGPRILRAETAAIAALSCWQALAGDWRDETARPLFRQSPEPA